MAALKEKTLATLLGSVAGVSVASGSTTIFTVPVGKTCRISHIVIRDTSGTTNGTGTASITGWRQTFAPAAITSGTGYCVVDGVDLAAYTEQAAGTAIQFTAATSMGAFTATIDIFGYLT